MSNDGNKLIRGSTAELLRFLRNKRFEEKEMTGPSAQPRTNLIDK